VCFVAFWILLTATGCSGTIHPPENPAQPVTAYVADYGRHSSIVLPAKDGGYVEWAFGDWNWYALGNTKMSNAVEALVCSPQATLGRRQLSPPASDDALKQTLEADHVLRFDVAADRAQQLQDALDQRFAEHAATKRYSDYAKLDCVKDPEHYWGMHNCNHVTMRWLKALGCRVDGMGILSHFTLASP
jgi:hypothetical protein